ncbi:Succinate--CoA ligase [ADP-forming] subunit alpha [Dirofilaria immitis]
MNNEEGTTYVLEAGQTAPPGRRMGHSGAIISSSSGSAAAKLEVMKSARIAIAETSAVIGKKILEVMHQVWRRHIYGKGNNF